MKKKLLKLMAILALFIPVSLVNAEETIITIDDIVDKINEKLSTETVTFPSVEGIKITLQAEKIQESNEILVVNSYEIEDKQLLEEMQLEDGQLLTKCIRYKYENNTITFSGNIACPEEHQEQQTEQITNMQSDTRNLITKLVTIAAYNLKGYEDANIVSYLQGIALLNDSGFLNISNREGYGIKIVVENGMATEYSINLNQISLPENQNDITERQYAYSKGGYVIEFSTKGTHEFAFSVVGLIQNDDFKEALNKIKEQIKSYDTLLEVYEITVTENDVEKKDGEFTFTIRMTDEMKQYKTYKLIYIDENNEAKEIVELTLSDDGTCLIGTLPHLSTYALIGTNDIPENPKTGIKTYSTYLGILLIATSSIYVIYKKKNKINNI